MFHLTRFCLGTYSRLLQDSYKTPLCEAVLEFFAKWTRCAFKKDGNHCVNSRDAHEKGHQSHRGSIFASGSHQSPVEGTAFLTDWIHNIQKNIEDLEQRFNKGDKDENNLIPKMHRNIMEDFYTTFPSASKFRSHLTCVCCVGKIPEHVLPCGHIICKACVQCFGEHKGQSLFQLHHCPLHPRNNCWPSPISINYKPEEAGVRTLCLDG